MTMVGTPPSAPTLTLQGIVVPNAHVSPGDFFKLTRRLTFQQKQIAGAGLGGFDSIEIRQTGILAGLTVRLTGSVVVTPGTGTVATTARWPYDLVRYASFSANGQSNLIRASGWKLRARDMMQQNDLTDRGVANGIGGASPGTSRTQGTLALATESWGLGQNVTAVGAGTYNFDIELFIPIAADNLTLTGAIFAQTSSTDLNLGLQYAQQSDLFTLTGNATVSMSWTVNVTGQVFSIPQAGDGGIIVPDLSVFHSLIENSYTALGNGDNDNIRLVGQGVGRQLLRTFWQVWNGSPSAPLPVNDTNFGSLKWLYGGNDTPEIIAAGHKAEMDERMFGVALAPFQGIAVWDFINDNQFRDSVDEGSATDLRLGVNIANSVTLTNPRLEYVQETLFYGAAGA